MPVGTASLPPATSLLPQKSSEIQLSFHKSVPQDHPRASSVHCRGSLLQQKSSESHLSFHISGSTEIVNWTGSIYATTDTDDSNATPQDHLLFADGSATANEAFANSLSFYDENNNYLGQGHEVSFTVGSTTYGEIVAIPEPSTIYSGLLILGLAGYRERRRPRTLVPASK